MALDSDFPLVRAVRIPGPLAALRALAALPYPFLLHSPVEDERARWSFFGADPFEVTRGGDHAAAIARFRALARVANATGLAGTAVPFTGGAVGYWAYDYGRRLERLPELTRDDLHLPDFVLGCYDVVGAYDHATREGWLFSSGMPATGDARAERAAARLDEFVTRLEAPAARRESAFAPAGEATARSTFHPDDYRRAVDDVREHIRGGDIFQANLSQRWTLPLPPAPPTPRAIDLFAALALHSPAPFAAFLGCGDHAIASASPERFLELRGRAVESRPIKGTRPRGTDRASDARLAAELLVSAKDRAENVMIVDVLRNDLGRVCETGSVRAPDLCVLESFAQVHHLVSTVLGTLRAGADAFDLLHACFPGGSITGAPKIRAMEILEALEPVRRHIYTGAIGYLDWRGDADWNIAIRTALVTADAVHFAAGGGITADSDADAEYEETLHKAEGMRAALEACVGPLSLVPAAAGPQ